VENMVQSSMMSSNSKAVVDDNLLGSNIDDGISMSSNIQLIYDGPDFDSDIDSDAECDADNHETDEEDEIAEVENKINFRQTEKSISEVYSEILTVYDLYPVPLGNDTCSAYCSFDGGSNFLKTFDEYLLQKYIRCFNHLLSNWIKEAMAKNTIDLKDVSSDLFGVFLCVCIAIYCNLIDKYCVLIEIYCSLIDQYCFLIDKYYELWFDW